MNQSSSDIFILGAARTPTGSFLGSLAGVCTPALGAVALKAAIERSQIAAQQLDEVIMGCVLSGGLKQAPARQALLQADIPQSVGASTINKVCGSGMKAIMLAHDILKVGNSQFIAAGGMESMSNAPFLVEKARSGLRMGHQTIKDHMFLDGLEDAETGCSMGTFAQETADQYRLSREEMDSFSRTSLIRAQTAQRDGLFAAEIAPVLVSTRQGTIEISQDEQPLNAKPEKIALLKPAFSKNGTLTAANSSSISDGASALVLARADALTTAHKPLAKLVAHTTHARAPKEFTLAPVNAIQNLLQRTGWHINDVDLFEINEAFAMVAMLPMRELHISHDRLNVHGGACALGHPIGSSGCRIVVTLLHALQQRKLKRGIAALCIGGGEATAIAIELL